MISPTVSICADARATSCKRIGAVEAVERIRTGGRCRGQVENIRRAYSAAQAAGEDPRKAVGAMKQSLPGILWSGTFEARRSDAIVEHSGLLVADLDDLDTNTMVKARAALGADPHAFAVFLSPSGHGLKAVFRVPADAARHGDSFEAVAARVREVCGVEVDASGKDLARLCFVSHDTLAHLNVDAVELAVPVAESKPAPLVPSASTVNAELLSVRQRIAGEVLGEFEWTEGGKGFCRCPGADLHTQPNGRRDCQVFLDGAPTVHCVHSSCRAAVDSANRRLRSAIGRAESPVPTIGASNADENLVARLAALPPADYDRRREAEAKAAGMRTSTLDKLVDAKRREAAEARTGQGSALKFDDAEPWPEPVNGDELLSKLASIYSRHVILPTGAADTLAVWTASTFCFQCFDFTPLIFVTAPERECGKSRVRDVAALLVSRPLSADSATPAFLFRTIELHRPTLFLDEFDNADLDTRRELLAILNGGYHRNGSVGRIVGEALEPRSFSTFCPKLLVSIGNPLPDATRSRAVMITMRRKLAGETVVSLRGEDFSIVRQKCRRWAQDNDVILRAARPAPMESLSDRQKDVVEPLLAIADAAGPAWGQRVREALAALYGGAPSEASNNGTLLLGDIRSILSDVDRIGSADLLNKLNALEERPWPSFCHGRQLNSRRLANLLAPYSIASRNLKSKDGSVLRGFHLDQFADAFARYLPENPISIRYSATSPANTNDSSLFVSATGNCGSGYENTIPTNKDGPGSGVADRKPENVGPGVYEKELRSPNPPSGPASESWPDESPLTEPPGDLPKVDANGHVIEEGAI